LCTGDISMAFYKKSRKRGLKPLDILKRWKR
jgi:hypothetical protein